jgi:hypothetical protein
LYEKYFNAPNIERQNPEALSFSPERILGHYILGRVTKSKPDYKLVQKQKPEDLAAKKFANTAHANLFSMFYTYLTDKIQERRHEKRKKHGIEGELGIYDFIERFVDRYFGTPSQPIDMDKVKKFATSLYTHLNSKDPSRYNMRLIRSKENTSQ